MKINMGVARGKWGVGAWKGGCKYYQMGGYWPKLTNLNFVTNYSISDRLAV